MYWLPSRSVTRQPSPSLMNTGVPPTALNARTGELTPPGMYCCALRKADSELTMERAAESGMVLPGRSTDRILKGPSRPTQPASGISAEPLLVRVAAVQATGSRPTVELASGNGSTAGLGSP